MTIHALTLALAALLHRGPIPAPVAAAIEAACHVEASKYPVDEASCVSLVETYASRESAYRADAVGDHGRSCSILQQDCRRIRGLSLTAQVALWLSDLRASSLASLSGFGRGGRRVADHRERLAVALLGRALAGVTDRQGK
jgi:hypothetical protein